jgi:hypothetical protein
MLKLKLTWEMETGEKFEEWTRPIELSLAEKELYSIISQLLKYLSKKAHQVTHYFYSWLTKYNNELARKSKTLTPGKAKLPILQLLILRQQILPSPINRANSSRASNSDWDNTRLLAQCRTRYLGYSHRHTERAK